MNNLTLSVALVAAACATAFAAVTTAGPAALQERKLVVCADPNNLPFSNRAGEGFENKLAKLLADDMGANLSYVWWAQRRGFARNTLNEGACDVWLGVASGVDRVATTRPYYRSTYVFVTRTDKGLKGLTLDDPRLKSLKIGVQMVGNDAMNTPPAHSLARRGLIDNVRGYMLYGDYEKPNPPAAIVAAVARGEVDVALVWGPLAGYFASLSAVALRIEPVTPTLDDSQWPMAYDISMGVRRDEADLQASVETILEKDAAAINAILKEFGVPTEETQ